MTNLNSNLDQTNIPHIKALSCHDITNVSGSNFVKAFSFLPPEKTDALIKIYAFCRIVDDCVDELESETDKQNALSYWKEQTIKLYQNNPDHPVMKELAAVIQTYHIPQDYLMGIITGCQMDIKKTRYLTYEELKDYCYHVASLVGLTCLKIFGKDDDNTKKMAVELGLALQLTNIMRDVVEDFNRDRIYIAKEDMVATNYTETDLKNKTENTAFENLMTIYYQRAKEFYQNAFYTLKQDKQDKLIAAKVMGKTYYRILNKIKKLNYKVLSHKVSLNKLDKIIIMAPILFKAPCKKLKNKQH